mgnify:FL=1
MQTKQTIFLIHGAGSIGVEWKNFEIGFKKQGFDVIRAKLRNHQVGSIHSNIGNLSLNDYLSDLEKQIDELDHRPIIIGHSMGGLLALKLCERNKSKLGILITPAAPAGINAISLSVIRIFISNIFRWKFWGKPVPPNYKSARYGVLHDLSEAKAIEVFNAFNCAESGRALCEIGFPFFYKNCPSKIDFNKYSCKTLIIGCGRDRITPISIARKLSVALGDTADYHEFSKFSHYIMENEEFDAVFEVCINWLNEQNEAS